jgi:hypothetical protein
MRMGFEPADLGCVFEAGVATGGLPGPVGATVWVRCAARLVTEVLVACRMMAFDADGRTTENIFLVVRPG